MMSDTEEDAGDHGIESEAEDENESNSQQEHESGFGTFCGALNEFGQDLARGFQTFAKSTADGVEGLAKGEFCQNTARGIDELGKNAASGFHDFVRNTANGFKDFAASEFCENTARGFDEFGKNTANAFDGFGKDTANGFSEFGKMAEGSATAALEWVKEHPEEVGMAVFIVIAAVAVGNLAPGLVLTMLGFGTDGTAMGTYIAQLRVFL